MIADVVGQEAIAGLGGRYVSPIKVILDLIDRLIALMNHKCGSVIPFVHVFE